MDRYVRIGRFLSLILRHKPEVIGITLDEYGWAYVDDILKGFEKEGHAITMEDLIYIVENNNKKRYSFNDDLTKIRANQGHSIKVNIELQKETPPNILYHGTAEKYYNEIINKGILKQTRNHVHLSIDIETALVVGKRHGKPIIFEVDTKQMYKDGVDFYLSKNNVWLVDKVMPKYIKLLKNK